MIRWAQNQSFPGYEISSDGLVRGRKKRGGLLKPRYLRGYVKYCLWRDGPCHVQAHRLVWETFVERIPDGLQINHKNGKKDDNRLENLEAVTRSENLKHRYRVLGLKGVRGSKNNWAKLNEAQVASIRRALLEKAGTHAELAAKFGVSRSNIAMISTRRTWPHVP